VVEWLALPFHIHDAVSLVLDPELATLTKFLHILRQSLQAKAMVVFKIGHDCLILCSS
jgi:hypothetical protein